MLASRGILAKLSDVVGSYILQLTEDLFDEITYSRGLYRDDGLILFKNQLSTNEISQWLEEFQTRVNQIAEGEYLQFTCAKWQPPQQQPQVKTHKSKKSQPQPKPQVFN